MQFEPAWKASIGPLTESGKGLLAPHLKPQLDLIDSFVLLLGTHTVNVKPKEGKMWFDTRQVVQTIGSGKLIWSRVMQKEFGPNSNTAPFRLAYYSIGIERDGARYGVQIYPDGRMVGF